MVRAAGSIRVTRPPLSTTMSRPPTLIAAVSTISPLVMSANLLVPPPMSTFNTV